MCGYVWNCLTDRARELKKIKQLDNREIKQGIVCEVLRQIAKLSEMAVNVVFKKSQYSASERCQTDSS